MTKALKRHKQVGECVGGGHRATEYKKEEARLREQRQEKAESETAQGMGGEEIEEEI